jgi:hypothetical protein
VSTRASFIALVISMAGCAPIQPLTVAESLGPVTWKTDETRGALVVYSDIGAAQEDEPFAGERSSYRLYSSAGELLRLVGNHASPFTQDPEKVVLPVGEYQVIARAAQYGLVKVPVVIRGGQTTVVDLNQEALSHATPANGNWVRLPNGSVIGSKPD